MMKYPNLRDNITHQPVGSSAIRTIGYDPETKELHVDFHATGKYIYQNVSQQDYQALMASESKGGHLHKHIKNKYPATKA